MYSDKHEIFIKIQSRPLRLVYLVSNRDDIIDAVTLYTHTWGGMNNIILPVPTNEEEATEFSDALLRSDPDCIFLPSRGIKEEVACKPLEQSPALKLWISKERIEQHLHGMPPLMVGKNSLSNLLPLLYKKYPRHVDNLLFYDINSIDRYKFEVAIQAGLPNESYRAFLKSNLSARVIPDPQIPTDLLKTALILQIGGTALSLTCIEAMGGIFEIYGGNPTYSDGGLEFWGIDDLTVLWIYLDKDNSFDAAVAYWNSGIRCNKLYMPFKDFNNNVQEIVPLIISALPSIRGIVVSSNISHDEAVSLLQKLEQEFKSQNKPTCLSVRYGGFKYDVVHCRIYSSRKDEVNTLVRFDESVHIKAPTPFNHQGTEYAFGFDAEAQFVSGRKLLAPSTYTMALILSNDIARIENLVTNKDGAEELLWNKNSIRANRDGIAGTTRDGKEIKFYLHSDNIIINQIIKQAGYRLERNDQTRYALGFVNRFGSLEKTVELIRSGGIEIVIVLSTYQEPKVGTAYQTISKHLVKQLGIDIKEANKIIDKWMPMLLSSSLVRRGMPLKCNECGLDSWYPIEIVQEFVECSGCAQQFQISLHKPAYCYKANEISRRLISEGGLAVLSTIAVFTAMDSSGFIEFGGNLFRPTESQSFVEIDIYWLIQDTLVIAECKSFKKGIGDDGIKEICISLEKTLSAAEKIKAGIVVLGIITANNDPYLPNLHSIVSEAVDNNKSKGIAVHLVINGKLYLSGDNKEATLPFKNSFLYRNKPKPNVNSGWIGKLVNDVIGVSSKDLYDHTILKDWEYVMCLESISNNEG